LHAKSDDFRATKTIALERRGGIFGWLRSLFGSRPGPSHQRAPSRDEWLIEEDEFEYDYEDEANTGDRQSWRETGHFEDRDEDLLEAPAQRLAAQPDTTRRSAQTPRVAYGGNGWLVANQLCKTYRGREVIKDVSLMVRRGEAIALLGPNGAGKTTLFYMITGLVRPDDGSITLEDYDVTSLPMYRRARLGIGYLPQEPSIFRGLNVEDNIRAVLEITQPDKRRRREELEALLEEFNIARLRKSMAIALSGGERRRLEIARALAGHPSFMLLDEPFAGVDPLAVADIQELVHHLKDRGIGVLITDHNVRETLGLVDRAYIIHSGELLTEGTPDDIVNDPEVRRYYLGDDFKL
jgi:lipopolysaccharide export system ATP-binding protein